MLRSFAHKLASAIIFLLNERERCTHFSSRRAPFARRGREAFSLVEVAVAIGIFAFTVAVILGLFAELTRDSLQSSSDTQLIGTIGYLDSYIRKIGSASAISNDPYFYFTKDSLFLARSSTPLASFPAGTFYKVFVTDVSPQTPLPMRRLWKISISYPAPAFTSTNSMLISQPLFK